MRKGIKDTNIIVVGIMLLACIIRVIGFGKYPGGVHVDEAYAGYEAWSLLNYGMDSWGYSNPIYLKVWGSGMSVMNSLLMMPFIRLWGLNEITIRLPQVIVAIASLYVFYLLLQRVWGRSVAIKGLFLMAIFTWHIMMSRWGLDCNLAPGFLIFSVHFFVRGLEKTKYMVVSALFFGLSLYCYVTIWLVVPILLCVWGIYGLAQKKIKFDRYVFVAMGILFLLALPLLLFVAVNVGFIPEIKTRFISIPQLVVFRTDELDRANFRMHLEQLKRLIIHQEDGLFWNATPDFGMYYLISMPFIIFGGLICGYRFIRNVRNRKFCFEFLVLSWIAIALCVGVVQGVNVYQINNCHIPTIILWTIGVDWICNKTNKVIHWIISGGYCILLVAFLSYYFTEFQEEICKRQLAGAGEAIERACTLYDTGEYEAICFTDELRHSRILFYTQWPVQDYIQTVEWQSYPEKYLRTASFGSFVWEEISANDENNYIYVVDENEAKLFSKECWEVEKYDYVWVVYKKTE